ncbi:hypothetical protein F2P81_024484 [Scophthalmus maximus]|uniref:Uncharacterized protein n=1 Tax=Scophthalmus maximus TaxID=52904 RepID=A0A6A4RZV1_SCOMX|nr:hypothetical protein F2P81_024484 [Scophthalmus maximus]
MSVQHVQEKTFRTVHVFFSDTVSIPLSASSYPSYSSTHRARVLRERNGTKLIASVNARVKAVPCHCLVDVNYSEAAQKWEECISEGPRQVSALLLLTCSKASYSIETPPPPRPRFSAWNRHSDGNGSTATVNSSCNDDDNNMPNTTDAYFRIFVLRPSSSLASLKSFFPFVRRSARRPGVRSPRRRLHFAANEVFLSLFSLKCYRSFTGKKNRKPLQPLCYAPYRHKAFPHIDLGM